MNTPKLIKISQNLDRKRIENPQEELSLRIRQSGLLSRVKPGDRVAITAGSRGIHNISAILKTVADELKKTGAKPFIVAAMGSQGGNTVEGQLKILEGVGITEKSVGAPIVSGIDIIKLGTTPSGVPLYIDKSAYDSDGIVVVNRVKPHTNFRAPVESGLCKMVSVGLGKRPGAETMHRHGLGPVIVEGCRAILKKASFLFGVGILENAFDETLDFRVVPPEEFERADEELLASSWRLLPEIPISPFDILIVDEMGKNISGSGMDTNVIGFWRRYGGEKKPDYQTLIVLDLTDESHGNAMGVGLADLITKKLAEKINLKVTYVNAITSGVWSNARVPITLEKDRECIETALAKYEDGEARIVRIKNTLRLHEVLITENLIPQISERNDLEIAGEPEPLQFDSSGNILPFEPAA